MKWIDRKNFGLFFYICFLGFMLIRYFNGLFLYQIIENPIRSPRVDPIVWTAHLLNIPDLVGHSVFISVLDLLILGLPIFILHRLYLDKRINKLVAIHSILFGIYVLILYCFPTLSIRKYLGLVLIPIAFIFTSNKRYFSYLELMRYYLLFVFTSASIWKILRNAVFDSTHMQLSLKAQHIDNFINWSNHHITTILKPIIANPMFCRILLVLAVFTQLSFVVGFFTKKYDRFLALLLIIFIVCDYLIMRIEYWEYIVFLPLLLGDYSKHTKATSSIN